MSDKLNGLPMVYWLSCDTDRIARMESQFDKWGIQNQKFWFGSLRPDHYEMWKDKVFKPELIHPRDYRSTCITISTLEMIRYWLENTNDKYLILMEDDYDLDLIEYWHFDWKTLMKNLPYDWDCIQLGFESQEYISFFLHPKTKHSAFGPVMINRWFAEKLLRIHTVQRKYFFLRRFAGYPGIRSLDIDHFFGFVGRTYQMPLITQDPYLDKVPKKHHFVCRDLYYDWWENERDNYTLKEFFTYGKPNDGEMTKIVRL
jgi:hypothetical protein